MGEAEFSMSIRCVISTSDLGFGGTESRGAPLSLASPSSIRRMRFSRVIGVSRGRVPTRTGPAPDRNVSRTDSQRARYAPLADGSFNGPRTLDWASRVCDAEWCDAITELRH